MFGCEELDFLERNRSSMSKFGHEDVETLKPATSEPCENSNGNGAGSTSSQVSKTKNLTKVLLMSSKKFILEWVLVRVSLKLR